MKASQGILEEVARQIALYDLSLEDAKNINSIYGWTIKGIPKKIHLS